MYKKITRSVLILSVIVFIMYIFAKEISQLNYLRDENEAMLERIDKLTVQNEKHRKEIQYMKGDKRYVEKVIREELGMIKEGEKIYKFDN